MPGFSISFARLPSWHAIARHAVVAVVEFGVGEIERHVRIVAPRGARVIQYRRLSGTGVLSR